MADEPAAIDEVRNRRRWPSLTLSNVVGLFCMVLGELALCSLALLVVVGIIARAVFDLPFAAADQIGGYLLVALTFLSMPTAHWRKSFHKVKFVQVRLPARMALASNAVFVFVSMVVSGVLAYEFGRQLLETYVGGEVATNGVELPLWIPQAVMPVGCTLLALLLARTLWTILLRGKE